MRMPRCGKVSGANCCPSAPQPCLIHSSILTTISFVFAPRNRWNENWLVSIMFLRCLCITRRVLSIFPWTWFLAWSSPTTPEKQRIGKNELPLRAYWTTRCRMGLIVLQTLLFRKIWNGDSICKRLPPLLFGRAFPLILWTTKVVIAQMLQSQLTIQNATWFQHLWGVLIPHLVNTFGLCHHLRHCLGLC